jgi:hypothetical protein
MREINFVECDTCAAKTGTPLLCRGCLNNRAAITLLGRRADDAAVMLAAARDANIKNASDVAAWRQNYRATLQALHDENNALRAVAATLSAKLAAKEAPRSLLEKFFNLPKD